VTAWADRSRVAAAYLNPALMAVLFSASARGYGRDAEPMVWPLVYLVAPLVLHRPTRRALPGNTRTHLSTWVRREPLLRAGFPHRAASLAPTVGEGLRFGLRHGVLALEDGRLLGLVDARRTSDSTLADLLSSASLVGRWLARSREPATAFSLLGVAV
jgi:ABC-three component (ABC-3C) system Middle Component 3